MAEILPAWAEKDREGKRALEHQRSTGRKEAKEAKLLQAWTVFHGKGRMTQSRAKCHRESFLDKSP